MEHAPVVDYQRIARAKERDRQWVALREPVTDLGVGDLANSACRPEINFIPSQKVGALRRRFEKTKERERSVARPAWLENGASEYVARYGVDERTAVDQRCGDVSIANQTSQQQIAWWPAPVGEIRVKREPP